MTAVGNIRQLLFSNNSSKTSGRLFIAYNSRPTGCLFMYKVAAIFPEFFTVILKMI
jgi:hypothetical protein